MKKNSHLGSDETEPEHDGAAARPGGGADPVAVLDRAQLEDALQACPGHRQRSVPTAGGHEQPVICNPLAALQLHQLLPGVDGGGARTKPELDSLPGVIVGGFDELALERLLSTQVASSSNPPTITPG